MAKHGHPPDPDPPDPDPETLDPDLPDPDPTDRDPPDLDPDPGRSWPLGRPAEGSPSCFKY